jgi:hypothetical protein
VKNKLFESVKNPHELMHHPDIILQVIGQGTVMPGNANTSIALLTEWWAMRKELPPPPLPVQVSADLWSEDFLIEPKLSLERNHKFLILSGLELRSFHRPASSQ